MEDSWDYKLPEAGESFEINEPPFRLLGWLSTPHSEARIDEKDPFRADIRGIVCEPKNDPAKPCEKRVRSDGWVEWVQPDGSKPYTFQGWSDGRQETDDGYRYSQIVGSEGWIFRIRKDSLRKYLCKSGLDLIAEVELSKRDQDYGYRGSSKKEPKEARYDKVILFRQDGSIETAEGRIGTW